MAYASQSINKTLDINGIKSSSINALTSAHNEAQSIMNDATTGLKELGSASMDCVNNVGSLCSSIGSKMSEMGTSLTSAIKNTKAPSIPDFGGGGSIMDSISAGASSLKDMAFDKAKEIGEEVSNLDYGAVLDEAAQPFVDEYQDVKNDITNECKKVKDKIKDTIELFHPNSFKNDLIGTIKKIAQIIKCPQQFLLDDIKRAYNNIKNRLKQINPKDLLQRAKKALIDGIKQRLPGVNAIVEFLANAAQYLKSFLGNKGDLASMIKDTLKQFGLDLSFFNSFGDVGVFKGIFDDLDFEVALGENESSSNMYIPKATKPKSIRCSELAKLIDQLTGSFRTGYDNDTLRYQPAMFALVNKDDLKSFLKSYMNGYTREQIAKDFDLNSMSLGFQTDTAISGNLAYMVEANNIIDEIAEIITKIGPNLDDFNNARAIIDEKRRYLANLGKENFLRLSAFNEGLHHIQQRSMALNVDYRLGRIL